MDDRAARSIVELEDENASLRSKNERLKAWLNEIRGRAYKDAFSNEPSNFAAWVLKFIEDDCTEKLEPQCVDCAHYAGEHGPKGVCWHKVGERRDGVAMYCSCEHFVPRVP